MTWDIFWARVFNLRSRILASQTCHLCSLHNSLPSQYSMLETGVDGIMSADLQKDEHHNDIYGPEASNKGHSKIQANMWIHLGFNLTLDPQETLESEEFSRIFPLQHEREWEPSYINS